MLCHQSIHQFHIFSAFPFSINELKKWTIRYNLEKKVEKIYKIGWCSRKSIVNCQYFNIVFRLVFFAVWIRQVWLFTLEIPVPTALGKLSIGLNDWIHFLASKFFMLLRLISVLRKRVRTEKMVLFHRTSYRRWTGSTMLLDKEMVYGLYQSTTTQWCLLPRR
jgi:hypothetical protein